MWHDNRIAKIGSSAFESPPSKNFYPSLITPHPSTFFYHFYSSHFYLEKGYVAMPGVQHLIDFVLNEVALCGNQGVYSFFTWDPLFPHPGDACHIPHVDFECHRNYAESPPSLRNMLNSYYTFPLRTSSWRIWLCALWCGPNVDLYPLSQALIGRFYSYTYCWTEC